jgi:hypothetical protein
VLSLAPSRAPWAAGLAMGLVVMLLVCALAALCRGAVAAQYDVVVYGSTPAGVAAATAAGRLGMKVALFEPLPMLGGMGAAGNLALNDGGNSAEHTGLALNFTLLNAAHYKVSGQVSHPESFVAEASFRSMLTEAEVSKVAVDCRLLSATAGKSGAASKVESIQVLCEPEPVTATVFIDASYDGEVMVAVGDVEYTAGRESIRQYNESLAGARAPSWAGVGGPRKVNALGPDGEIIKYVANLSELAPPGEADDRLMAFQHRMCISGDPDRIAWPKPPGYNAEDFLIIQRALEAGGIAFHWSPLPGYPGPKKK